MFSLLVLATPRSSQELADTANNANTSHANKDHSAIPMGGANDLEMTGEPSPQKADGKKSSECHPFFGTPDCMCGHK